jgi:methionyl-tRNA synthetase
MPVSAGKLLNLLGVPGNKRNLVNGEISPGLEPGTKLPRPVPVFPRYINTEEDLSDKADCADR